MTGLTRIRSGIHSLRLARRMQIPAGEIEEVNRLFKNPTADAIDIVPPITRSLSVRTPRQLDQYVKRIAHCTGGNHFLDFPPKRRQPQFMTDCEDPPVLAGESNQVITIGKR